MKFWPALDLRSGDPTEFLIAALDDFAPTGVEEGARGLRAFFATPDARDAACAALDARYVVEAVEVDDEDWARRSQEHLAPVTVGRITIRPRAEAGANGSAGADDPDRVTIVIPPSM